MSGNGQRQLPRGTPEAPEADERVTDVWVLVAVQHHGGEGIYGAQIGGVFMPFITSYTGLRDKMEQRARADGAYTQIEKKGGHMEWRHYTQQREEHS